ncbi:hypothetical protein [Thaumasiovibrio sp. DFM-14]|uniref:hypothetical protein n=1 Tax=Thaumasiovibrio sp. DFM-14 TaxID=3384792 RepID=UPI0039A1E1EE
MNYIHRMTLYLVALLLAFMAVFVSPEPQLSMPMLLGVVALISGFSIEYIFAPDNRHKE